LPRSDAVVGLLGALVGGVAAVGGAFLQARSAARLQLQQAEKEEIRRRADSAEHLKERQRALARRYLFQVDEAVDSLLHRLDNWTRRGGQWHAGAREPGYWEATTLYAMARALGAERVLALEGIYLDLEALWPDRSTGLPPRAVEDALRDAGGERFFQYDRLALSEAVLDRVHDGYRLLVYSEFRRRYEDPAWNRLLEPARAALTSLTHQQLESLERSLTGVKQRIEAITTMRETRADEPQ
jgi:hypothetical protein